MRHFIYALMLATMLAGTPAIAKAPAKPVAKETIVEVSPINDPIEPFNRAVFQFNRYVDMIVLKPVTTAYDFILPQFMRNGVHNFLGNLNAPIIMANSLLQGDFGNFETTLHRFVINTTLGMGGVNDVATALHVKRQINSDFGQTMGTWGADHGFYLVLPIVGPSSARDAAGGFVDTFADPYNVAIRNSDREWLFWTRMGVTAVDVRSSLGQSYDDTMNNAVDPYVTFRSIYVQQRAYMVQSKAADSYGAVDAQ